MAATLIADFTPPSTGAGRPSAPNPYTDDVKALIATFDAELGRTKAALQFPVTTSKNDKGEDVTDRAKIAAKVGDAIRAAGEYSPRFVDQVNGKSVVLVAYAVPKITRKAKTHA